MSINLIEVLRNTPACTKLYSTVHGVVHFSKIVTEKKTNYPIRVISFHNGIEGEVVMFSSDGKLYNNSDGECILFPEKNLRDWSKFNYLLRDKSLVWCWNDSSKYTRFFGFYDASGGTIYDPIVGTRHSLLNYDHYEVYEGITPDWAIDVITELED